MIDEIISNFGKIDILVNNAGICNYDLFTSISDEDIHKIIDVNLLGTINVTKSVLNKSMINNSNLSS